MTPARTFSGSRWLGFLAIVLSAWPARAAETPEAAAPADSAGPIHAPVPADTADTAESAEAPSGHAGKAAPDSALPAIPISLEDMIKEVLLNNPQVHRARLAWRASEKAARAAWGGFEPELAASLQRTAIERERGRFLESSEECNVEVEGILPIGTKYSLGFTLKDYENPVYTLDDPNAFAGVTLTQPLLKGILHGAPMTTVRLARSDRRIAYHAFRARLMQVLREAEEAYWQLAFAETKYRYALESVEIARELVKDSRAWLGTGKISQLEMMESEAGLDFRAAALADARQEYLEAAGVLRILLARQDGSGLPLSAATPLADGGGGAFPAEDTASAVRRAFHPDLLIRDLEIDKEEAGVDFRLFQSLPELNMKYRYGYNGVGGSRGQALYELAERYQETWSFGLEIKIPLFLGLDSRNQLSRARLQRRMARKEMQALDFELEARLRSLSQRDSSQVERMRSAEKVVRYREKLMEAERSMRKAGKSNSRLVYEAEERLAQARQWALETRVKHRITRLQIAAMAGVLLKDRGLEGLHSGGPRLASDLVAEE
ncbi:MAG TPA: TolC family protein [Fibrobacteria bacterium]|nr:TolC family protein [Fibrobacteria bacterium]